MNTVVTVSGIALFGAVCGLLIKRTNHEIALLFSLGTAIVLFLYLMPQVRSVIESAQALLEDAELFSTVSISVKGLGIALTAKIATAMCKDAGENALSVGVELAAKTAVLLLTLPLLQQFILLIQEILAL